MMIKTFKDLNDNLNNYIASYESYVVQRSPTKLESQTAYRLPTDKVEPKLTTLL